VHNQIEFANTIINFSNELLKNDPDLAKVLFSQEWPVNTWTSESSKVIINGDKQVTRLLGVLNGIVGSKPDNTPYMRAVYSDKGKLLRFELNLKDGK